MELYSGTTFTTTLSDDTGAGTADTANINNAIDFASRKIDRFCLTKYSADQLASSDIVNKCAIVIALCYLSKRRALTGKQYCDEAREEWEPWLTDVRDGIVQIPDVNGLNAQVPILTNLGYAPGLFDPIVVTPTTPAAPAPEHAQNTYPFPPW
jgi:phage gp36-like protein